MKIALVYNIKPKPPKGSCPEDFYSEFDSQDTIDAISLALRTRGHEVFQVEANQDLFEWLRLNKTDFVFNIAEGVSGANRESQVPAVLDLLGIPYTGSGTLALALTLDKAKSKKIFRYEGIPTPNFQLFSKPGEKLDKKLKFPLIAKPNREGSAKGISKANVRHDAKSMHEQIKKIQASYKQEVLVEEFIEGKELTVGILGNYPSRVLSILEIDFENCKESGEFFYSWRMKEFQGNQELNLVPTFHCPARLDERTKTAVKTIALEAHQALGCVDFSRTDIRLSSEGIPYVLEVNPLPGLDPKESNLPVVAQANGIGYEELINTILDEAVARCKGGSLKKEADSANRILASH